MLKRFRSSILLLRPRIACSILGRVTTEHRRDLMVAHRRLAAIQSGDTESVSRIKVPVFQRSAKKNQWEKDRVYFRDDAEFVKQETPPFLKMIQPILENLDPVDRYFSNEECSNLRSAVIANKSTLSRLSTEHISRTVDCEILQSLIAERRILCGLSYVEFLSTNDLFNPGCVAPASTLIRDHFLHTKAYGDDDDGEKGEVKKIEDLAAFIFERVDTGFPKNFREYLMPSAIASLACSSQWPRALEWVDQEISQDRAVPCLPSFGPLIIKSLECGKLRTSFDLFRLYFDMKVDIGGIIFHALWKRLIYLVRNNERNDGLAVLNSFIDATRGTTVFGLSHPVSIIPLVKDFFSSQKNTPFTVCDSTISAEGRCESCGENLETLTLTSGEFESMRDEIMKHLVDNISVYRWTHPRERRKFDEVLDEFGPFDIVVDGLNVVHSNLRLIGRGRLQLLLKVLESLRTNDKMPVNRILVLLRPYVKLERFKWLGEEIARLATIFVCSHETTDDSFLLYASMFSGQNCYFVTNDLLRGQNEFLSTKASAVFQQWRRLRQITFLSNCDSSVRVMWPSDYAIWPQRNGSSYHFPLQTDIEQPGSRFNWRAYADSMKWLCVQKAKAS